MFHFISLKLNLQEGQNPGPPPLIPGLGQHGGPGRHGPHNQGPVSSKGNETHGWIRMDDQSISKVL